MDHLKFSKPFKYATSSGIHMVAGQLDLKSTYYHKREEEKRGEGAYIWLVNDSIDTITLIGLCEW